MSLLNLHSVLETCKEACSKVSLLETPPLPVRFKEAYSDKIVKIRSFSRNDKIVWGCNDVAEIWSRGNGTKFYLPSIAFYIARELVPLYKELVAYRSAVEQILVAHGKSLRDVDEADYVPYIQASTNHTEEEKGFLVRFVTDGAWWGKGRQINRAQDFFESPLMQCAGLTQENQSEIARIAKQLSEQEDLLSLINYSLEDEFCRWYLEVQCKGGNRSETNSTVRHYKTGLKAISADQGEKDTQKWCGIYEYLFGVKPGKPVFCIGTLVEFERVYGLFSCVFDKDAPDGVDSAKHSECYKYTKGPRDAPYLTDHGNLSAAFNAYRKFLQWRDAEQKKKDEPNVATVDLLTIAIQVFKRERSTWVGKEGIAYASVNTDVRSYYGNEENWSVERLSAPAAFSDFCIKHTWMMRNGAGCWSKLSKYDDAKRHEFLGWIDSNIVRREKPLAEVLVKDNGFYGFTNKAVTELLMKFHPDQFCLCNSPTIDALNFLNIAQWGFKENFVYDDYLKVMGVCAYIRERLIADGVTATLEGDTVADYITVNEFLIFVHHNKDLIKETVMSKAMKKPTTNMITTGKATISDLLKNKEDSLMTMLIAGLLTKPLAILAGVSGTGKSRMVRHLAYKTCLDEDLKPSDESAPGNFKMVQVKPSWHDSADLLGYRSAVNENHEYVSTDFVKFVLKAHAYPNTPFFVCLDEMNLAPVEHYFAEFLSACESIRKIDGKNEWTSDPIVAATDFDNNVLNLGGDIMFESADAALDAALKKTKARIEKEGLFIPRNLFVVGTVNMDDSTGGFSRKVLDRAMTIVMNEVNLEDLKNDDKDLTLSEDNLFTMTEIAKFINREDFDKSMLGKGFIEQLESIRKKLEKTPFALAYRFARETCMYKKALLSILDADEVVKKSDGTIKKDAAGVTIEADRACGDIALDHMILMKLLPRLTGTTEKRDKVIKDINVFLDTLIKEKLVSKETLQDMVNRAGDNGGYLSFWP